MKTILLLLLVICLTGCVMIVNYAPRAEKASLYTHEQNATNMVVNETIHDFGQAKLADKVQGIVGADISGNSAKIGSDNKAGLR